MRRNMRTFEGDGDLYQHAATNLDRACMSWHKTIKKMCFSSSSKND